MSVGTLQEKRGTILGGVTKTGGIFLGNAVAEELEVTRREENKDVYLWPIGKHQQRTPAIGPVLVEKLLGKDICDVACGEAHYAALTVNGELYLWGR